MKRIRLHLYAHSLGGTTLVSMRKGVVSRLVVIALLLTNQVSHAQSLPATLQAQVNSLFFENLYAHT